MKHEWALPNLGIRPSDPNAVARANAATPESVPDFIDHPQGSAEANRSRPEGPWTTRQRSNRRRLPIEFRHHRRRWMSLPILQGGSGVE
jgi:hypothetical protein